VHRFWAKEENLFKDFFRDVADYMVVIEILEAMLEEACLKKGRIFSADLHPIL
jgi:hypothetical protein